VPDLVDFTVTPIANATISVPRWTISGKVVNSKNQATVLQDFTGANALTFPNVLSNLTAAERDEFVRDSCLWILRKRFPGAFA